MSINTASIPRTNSLSQKRIFIYWIPLAISWIMMGSEMPFIFSILARLSESQIMIAAFGIVGPLSIIIESPVISLLSTTTTLARSKQSYLMLRKFVIHLMWLTFIIHGAIAFTPLLDILLSNIMKVPTEFHPYIATGMKIMILWSPLIGWRRFLQGLMIRFDQTKYIGYGTIIRLISSGGTAAYLGLVIKLPGIQVATYALEVGVLIELIFTHIMTRPLVKEKFGENSTLKSDHLSYKELVKFHMPLAASTFIFLLTMPAISTALGKSADPELYLAAWPVLMGLFFLVRTPTQALPEVIIALFDKQKNNELKNFSLKVGIVLSTIVTLMAFTPLGKFYFEELINIQPHLSVLILPVLKFGIPIPLIMAVLNYQRGKFTSLKKTSFITFGLSIELFTLIAILMIGLSLKLSGTLIATIAITVSYLADYLVLSFGERKLKI
jgi:progressive ankylosis protein